MATKPLKDATLKSLKAREKTYKVADGNVAGLFVAVTHAGRKFFRLQFVFEKKFQLLTIGKYPEMSLSDARIAAMEAKRQIAAGINPCREKQKAKTREKSAGITFKQVAEEWQEKMIPGWSEIHTKDIKQKLECYILPRIGDTPIAEIGRAEVKTVLDILDAQGKAATLKKVRTVLSQVFSYGIAADVPGMTFDPTSALRAKGVFKPHTITHRAAVTNPKDVSRLMQAIASYAETSLITCIALKFSALTFARPGEIRHAEWAEIDFDDRTWRIPAAKMKMGEIHIVPLAVQTIELLQTLKPMTEHSRYLFPSTRSATQPMSEATVLAAIRRMGYTKEQMSAHGFRGMASTRLNEMGYNRDWIERQLAHGERNKVRASYNHTDFLADRRRMMQEWADHLWKLMAA